MMDYFRFFFPFFRLSSSLLPQNFVSGGKCVHLLSAVVKIVCRRVKGNQADFFFVFESSTKNIFGVENEERRENERWKKENSI